MKDECLHLFPALMDDIKEENSRQIKKWGIQDHEPAEWLMFLTEEVGELSEAISEWQFRNGHERNVFNEAIQTATLAIKIAEMFRIEENKRLVAGIMSLEALTM